MSPEELHQDLNNISKWDVQTLDCDCIGYYTYQ